MVAENLAQGATQGKVDGAHGLVQSVEGQEGIAPVEEAQAALSNEELQALVEQLIDKLYVMKTQGQTDTTLTLKNTEMFEGATITVTEFDHAQGEFNISFANLTQQAKEILDRQQSQEVLKQALQERGYTVHILATTTEKELQLYTPTREQGPYQEKGEQEQQGREEQERDEDNQ